jgi:hypothetical protein
MADPSQPRPQSPTTINNLATLNHQSARTINHEASEPSALAPISCATIDFLITLGSPNLSVLYGPDAYLRLSDSGVLLLDSSELPVSMEWPYSHAMSVENEQRFDPFDGVLDTTHDVGPSRSDHKIIDLVSPSPNLPPTISRQIWIERATNPENLNRNLLRYPQDLQPSYEYEIYDLPLLCAQHSCALILRYIKNRWSKMTTGNWRLGLDRIVAREQGLQIWPPLATWLRKTKDSFATFDGLEVEKQKNAKRHALKQLKRVALEREQDSEGEITWLLGMCEAFQVCEAIAGVVDAGKGETTNLKKCCNYLLAFFSLQCQALCIKMLPAQETSLNCESLYVTLWFQTIHHSL